MVRFIRIDSNCGLNLYRSCLIFGERCFGTSAITPPPFSYCQTSMLTCRCATIHNNLREDCRNFPPKISLTRSPWSKKCSCYMLLCSVSSEKFFRDALTIQAKKFQFFCAFLSIFCVWVWDKTGAGFVSMSPDLRRLINMKRKEVKFRIIRKSCS